MLEPPASLSFSSSSIASTGNENGYNITNSHGGHFTFEDGGSFSGGWLEGKAHGYGVCTGPKGQGEYAGAWKCGFETSGTYTWPSGNIYAGQWSDGRRHGLGVETHGRWLYRGEWSAGAKSRYGVRHSTVSGARYEGTWASGLQDGFGVETYADQSTYQGQWVRGLRHGYGVRQCPVTDNDITVQTNSDSDGANTGRISRKQRKQHHYSLPLLAVNSSTNGRDLKPTDNNATGNSRPFSTFNSTSTSAGLNAGNDGDLHGTGQSRTRSRSVSLKRTLSNSLNALTVAGRRKNKLQAGSTGDVAAQVESSPSLPTMPDEVVETYMGEWQADKRCGYGISERSDGIRYCGEWKDDKRCGYGLTTLPDGKKVERGKYIDNVLVKTDIGVSGTRKFFDFRLSKVKERVEAALNFSRKAAQLANQKSDIAALRRNTAKVKADEAEEAAKIAIENAQRAKHLAAKYEHQATITSIASSDNESGFQTKADVTASHRTVTTMNANRQVSPVDHSDDRYDFHIIGSKNSLPVDGSPVIVNSGLTSRSYNRLPSYDAQPDGAFTTAIPGAGIAAAAAAADAAPTAKAEMGDAAATTADCSFYMPGDRWRWSTTDSMTSSSNRSSDTDHKAKDVVGYHDVNGHITMANIRPEMTRFVEFNEANTSGGRSSSELPNSRHPARNSISLMAVATSKTLPEMSHDSPSEVKSRQSLSATASLLPLETTATATMKSDERVLFEPLSSHTGCDEWALETIRAACDVLTSSNPRADDFRFLTETKPPITTNSIASSSSVHDENTIARSPGRPAATGLIATPDDKSSRIYDVTELTTAAAAKAEPVLLQQPRVLQKLSALPFIDDDNDVRQEKISSLTDMNDQSGPLLQPSAEDIVDAPRTSAVLHRAPPSTTKSNETTVETGINIPGKRAGLTPFTVDSIAPVRSHSERRSRKPRHYRELVVEITDVDATEDVTKSAAGNVGVSSKGSCQSLHSTTSIERSADLRHKPKVTPVITGNRLRYPLETNLDLVLQAQHSISLTNFAVQTDDSVAENIQSSTSKRDAPKVDKNSVILTSTNGDGPLPVVQADIPCRQQPGSSSADSGLSLSVDSETSSVAPPQTRNDTTLTAALVFDGVGCEGDLMVDEDQKKIFVGRNEGDTIGSSVTTRRHVTDAQTHASHQTMSPPNHGQFYPHGCRFNNSNNNNSVRTNEPRRLPSTDDYPEDDIVEWFQRNSVVLFFLTLNLLLAAIFYKIITSERR